MTRVYAFNGDADGLCALQQLRLADPRPGELVTGVKRDINLLERVPARAGDECTVLDVSPGGAKIVTDVAIDVRDRFGLTLTPEHAGRYECEVVWRRGKTYGVKFVQ